jgi:hypothetical protein
MCNGMFWCQHTFWQLRWEGFFQLQSNLSFSDMCSEIDPKNVIMVTLEEILEEQHKTFEAHRQAAEEHRKTKEVQELQEFLACFKKERQGKVTQVKEVILPSTNGKVKVMPVVSTTSPSVTPEDVTACLMIILNI